ncbi:Flagellar basal body rod protein FlgB (plasmid) [Rhodovastum atsumiense]|uniref:flagellar biosynthesis protein FlgG n=1 Tax=Rhodovastum atsumiense TaxID=504468 RepID=UPI00202561CE|nr:flagellar biosynthesis protein FlgG [Rhodovastum atsumiense]CAH2605428.1 Flagellar basal body rod protein FlgB [Rhodovastum atsumiense]
MLEEIDLFRLTGARMRYLTERQTTLARNIANADTPHYRAQDLVPFSFNSHLLQGGPGQLQAGAAAPLRLARTNAAHVPDARGARLARIDSHGASYGEKPDGNTVSLEEQMVKSNDVANAFHLATAAYAKSMTLLKTGIGGGR